MDYDKIFSKEELIYAFDRRRGIKLLHFFDGKRRDSGVYVVFDKNDECLCAGWSSELAAMVANHVRGKEETVNGRYYAEDLSVVKILYIDTLEEFEEKYPGCSGREYLFIKKAVKRRKKFVVKKENGFTSAGRERNIYSKKNRIYTTNNGIIENGVVRKERKYKSDVPGKRPKNFLKIYERYPAILDYWNYDKNTLLIEEAICADVVFLKCPKCGRGRKTQAYKLIKNCLGCKEKEYLESPIPEMPELKRTVAEDKLFVNHSSYNTLMKEWDYDINVNIDADIISSSLRLRVGWRCKDCGYRWGSSMVNRTYNSAGCPVCNNAENTKKKNYVFSNDFPELLKQWNFKKNEEEGIQIDLFGCFSHKKVWWICLDCGHGYKDKLIRKTRFNSKCPKCKNHYFEKKNIVECEYCGHSFNYIKYASNKGRKRAYCPNCKRRQDGAIKDELVGTSIPERKIFYFFRVVFGNSVISKHSISKGKGRGVEIDVFVPEFKFGVEYDGVYFHKDKVEFDRWKNDFLKNKGINLMRVREVGLEKIEDRDVIHKVDSKNGLQEVMESLFQYIKETYSLKGKHKRRIKKLLDKDISSIIIPKKFFLHPFEENSMAAVNPELLNIWDYEKNNVLPGEVTPHSNVNCFWTCGKCKAEWEASPSVMSNRKILCLGCHKKARKYGLELYSLVVQHPELIELWDKKLNNNKEANEVFGGKNRVYYWRCGDCGFRIKRSVKNILENDVYCRRCKTEIKYSFIIDGVKCKMSDASKKMEVTNFTIKEWIKKGLVDNKLLEEYMKIACNQRVQPILERFPEALKYWDQKLNPNIDIKNIGAHSKNITLVLKCPVCGFVWKMSPRTLIGIITTNKIKNPCSRCNSFAVAFPELLEYWNYEKNIISPFDVKPKSAKRVWWKCKKCGRETNITISGMAKHPNCLGCYVKENSIAVLYPELLSEWDYKGNKNLTPENVTNKTSKKIKWICKNCGFHWLASTNQRTNKGKGCPECTDTWKYYNGGRSREKMNYFNEYKELLKFYNFSKNKDVNLSELRTGEKYWWKCNDCEYEWNQTLSHMITKTKNKKGLCKRCSILSLSSNIPFKDDYPEFVKEWDYEKNFKILGYNLSGVTAKTDARVWWICGGCGHNWAARVQHRTVDRHGCPKCSKHNK